MFISFLLWQVIAHVPRDHQVMLMDTVAINPLLQPYLKLQFATECCLAELALDKHSTQALGVLIAGDGCACTARCPCCLEDALLHAHLHGCGRSLLVLESWQRVLANAVSECESADSWDLPTSTCPKTSSNFCS